MVNVARGDIKVEIHLDKDKFSINDAYEMRQQRQKEAETSLTKWGGMDDEHREVLEQIVKRAIESMHANTHQWLPHCVIEGAGGDKIDVRMSILLSDIEAEVDMMTDATDFEIEAAKRKALERFRGDGPQLDDGEFLQYVETRLTLGHRLGVEETRRLINIYKLKAEQH